MADSKSLSVIWSSLLTAVAVEGEIRGSWVDGDISGACGGEKEG